MPAESDGPITALLQRYKSGDPAVMEELVPLLYQYSWPLSDF